MHRVVREPKRAVLFTPETIAKRASTDLTAEWSWYNNDSAQGLVQWTFRNSGTTTKTGILLRNGYIFAGAYWPVYVGNSEFGTSFATDLIPLIDSGVQNNSPPVGIVSLQGHYEVYFLFTLAPNQSYSMLEGGFSSAVQPSGIAMYEVTLENKGPWCVGYDQKRVTDWDLQTGTNLRGYSPNPSTFNTVQVVAESDTPYDVLPFNDTIVMGACTAPPPPPTPPSPSPSPSPESCTQIIDEGLKSRDVSKILDGVICLMDELGISFIQLVKHFASRRSVVK